MAVPWAAFQAVGHCFLTLNNGIVFLDKHLEGKLHVWLGMKVLGSTAMVYPQMLTDLVKIHSFVQEINPKLLSSPKDDVHKV